MGEGCVRRFVPLLLAFATPAMADHELEGRDTVSGRSLYVENCASCHGTDLKGQPDWQSTNADGVLSAPPHDATGHTWHHDNALLFDYTKLGGENALEIRGVAGFNSGMPAFEATLSDGEIWDILAYIRSTWPVRMQQVQASRSQPH